MKRFTFFLLPLLLLACASSSMRAPENLPPTRSMHLPAASAMPAVATATTIPTAALVGTSTAVTMTTFPTLTPLPIPETYCLWPGDTLSGLAGDTQVDADTLLAGNADFTGFAGSTVHLPAGSIPPSQWKRPLPDVHSIAQMPVGKSGVYLGYDNRQKRVALTFDVGYQPENRQLLAMLAEHNVRATFFVLGSSVGKHPEMIADILGYGHELGNHSWSHQNMLTMTKEEIELELDSTELAVQSAYDGASTRPFFRAPFGAINTIVAEAAQGHGYYVIGWTIDSGDWVEEASAEQIYQRVARSVCPGAIIVMHDANPANQEALPRILAFLEDNGYTIVPLSTLLPEN